MLSLDLVDKGLVTDQLVLTVGYDIENLTDANRRSKYQGEITTDRYGRKIPKHAHGTANLECPTSSTAMMIQAMLALYDRIVDRELLTRRITVVANNVVSEKRVQQRQEYVQMDLFTDYAEEQKKQEALKREKSIQAALLDIKKRYGKNAVLKGTNLQEGATAKDRNAQIGGHKA